MDTILRVACRAERARARRAPRRRLDVATASTLRRCLVRLQGQSVTLDFSGVTFMDSSQDRSPHRGAKSCLA